VEVYQAKAPEEGQKFKGLGAEEVLVYQAIDASGDVGIWTRDLRARTNLQQPAVTRILKAWRRATSSRPSGPWRMGTGRSTCGRGWSLRAR